MDGKPVATRYATYGYDDTGRAILRPHAGNVDKITLDNHEAGRTVLTKSPGQKTVYRADKPGKLAEVGNAAGLLKRYSYDELGRVSAVHSALGIATASAFATAFAYDAAGMLASRTDAAGSADAASMGLAYDPSGNATGITAGNGVKTLHQ